MIIKGENNIDQEKDNRKPSIQHLANESLVSVWTERTLFEAE